MDNFDVPAHSVSFVISRDEYDHLIFDEYITMLTFHGITVSDA
jgi:hypothetical protein